MPALTVQAIVRRPAPKDRREEIADSRCRGLYIVFEPSGTKRWQMRYKVDGRSFKHSLGPFGLEAPFIGLDEARRTALAWRERGRKLGQWPHIVAELERRASEQRLAAELSAPTFEWLVTEYQKRLDRKTKTPEYRLSGIRKHVLPHLKSELVREITPARLEQLLTAICDSGESKKAADLASTLRQMFKFAIRPLGLRQDNPALGVLEGVKAFDVRERKLTDAEIRGLWATLDRQDIPMSAQIRLALKIQLLTGVRIGELCGAEWREMRLDGDEPVWEIPGSRTKQGKTHVVPLAPGAVSLLKELHRLTGDTPFCMPAGERLMAPKRSKPRKRPVTGHLDSHAVAKALRRCVKANVFDFPAFTSHDLRRTMRNALTSRLKVGFHIAELVIGHTIGTATSRHYDQDEQLDERRVALERWDVEVRRILINAKNVVSLAERRA